jgi:hypothetical protein
MARQEGLACSPVRTQPVMINGLAGPVVLEAGWLSGRYRITVGAHPAARTGRNRYALPTAGGGTAEATLRGGFFDPYPSLVIGGVAHRTGPQTPLSLRVLSLLPLALIGVGGLLGGLIAGLALVANFAVLRSPARSFAVKALSVLGVTAAAAVLWLLVASLIRQLID